MMISRAAVVLIAATFASLAGAEEAITGPRIFCEQPEFNFGTVDSQNTIEHTFVLKNIGDTTLEISEVRAACGCTVANISPKTVPPGETSQLTARLNLQGRSGPQSKAITINSNDPQNPSYRVNMAGTIAQAYQVSPDRLVLGDLQSGAEATQTIELTALTDAPLAIQSIESSDSNIRIEQEVVQENRHVRLNVTLKAQASPGAQSGNVRVNTGNPARPVIDIPVFANVTGGIIFGPPEIGLPAKGDGKPMTRFVVVRSGSGESPFMINEVILPDPSMKSTILPFGNQGQGYRVQIENITPSPELNGQSIRILTSSSQTPEISVPFRVTP